MIQDPIVQEVRAARDAHAARFNYNLAAIFADLKRSEQLRDRQQFPLLLPPEPSAPRVEPSVQRIRFNRR